MRSAPLLASLALVASCFPDADQLRGGGSPPIGGSGGGIQPPIGGGGPGGSGGSGGTGGTVTGGTGGGGPARQQACSEFAMTMAIKGFSCSPLVLQRNQGTMAGYVNRLQVLCNVFDVPGSTWPPRPFRPCADAIAAQTCADYVDDIIPPACVAVGMYPEGATCGTGFQCQTDFCDLPGGGACGRCVRLPGVNQPCLDDSCAAGLVCNDNLVCVTPRTSGQPCAIDSPCRPSLFCRRTCMARGGTGAACMDDDECDFFRSSLCNETRGQCVPATAGQRCVINPDGSYIVCAQRGWCRMDGTCLPAAADNGACSTTDGPNCVWPAGCVSNVCRLPAVNRACGPAGAVRDRPADPLEALDQLAPAQRAGGVHALFRSLAPRKP